MRQVISVDRWGAALLAALGLAACGGTVSATGSGTGGTAGSAGATGTGGSGGATGGSGGATGGSGGTSGAGGSGGSAGQPSKFPCLAPQPVMVGGVDTGFDTCQGGFLRRRKVVECPSLIPRSGACAEADAGVGGGCTTDADCTAKPNGYCGPYLPPGGGCGCFYGCRTDADCGANSICLCGDPVGQCVQTNCTSDASCGAGLLCSSYAPDPGCPATAFACQAPGDTCASDSDCASGEQCSYDGTQHVCKPVQCAIGRPFLVENSARLAPVAARHDWAGPALAPRLEGLGSQERAELARHWTRAALMEHASIAAFARFALELLSLGAPPDLIEQTHAALADETRHARLCFRLASAYAGREVGPGALDVSGALEARTPRAILSTLVREGCIGETVAALEAAEALEHAIDPAVRDVLATIARDETRHAELAWRTLGWALASGSADLTAAAREALEAALHSSAPNAFDRSPLDAPLLLAHGIVSGAFAERLRRDAIERAVRPCARALLKRADRRVRVALRECA